VRRKWRIPAVAVVCVAGTWAVALGGIADAKTKSTAHLKAPKHHTTTTIKNKKAKKHSTTATSEPHTQTTVTAQATAALKNGEAVVAWWNSIKADNTAMLADKTATATAAQSDTVRSLGAACGALLPAVQKLESDPPARWQQ